MAFTEIRLPAGRPEASCYVRDARSGCSILILIVILLVSECMHVYGAAGAWQSSDNVPQCQLTVVCYGLSFFVKRTVQRQHTRR